jgi:minimal PKS chain-length factor (CLF/KS beta)
MSGSRARRQAVVTGLGVVAPNGVGTEAFWKAVQQGEFVLGPVTREGCTELPLKVAGEVAGFDPADLVEDRFLVQTDRFTHFAMAAADMALDEAHLATDPESPFAIGVVTAAGSGGGEFGQRELQELWAAARSSSARTSPSPGSTPPAPARSPSAAASRAPAGCCATTRPAGSTCSRTPPAPSPAAPTPWWPAPPRRRSPPTRRSASSAIAN